MSDVFCYITVIRHLMLYVMLYNCYQTSDVICCQTSGNSYMTADVCCHITVITRLMSDFTCYVIIYNCCQTSDV